MIQQFYTNQQNIASGLLQQVTESLKKYNDRDLDATLALQKTLDSCIQSYAKNNKSEKESRFESLKSELTTALRGVNPYSLEKQQLHRNEMIRNTAFRILQASEELIRLELVDINEKLRQAEELIAQIVLAAIQSKLIENENLGKINTQAKIEKLWTDLGNDPNLNIAVKKVQLMVSQPDITILLGQTIDILK
jgi:hypothetical protein